MSPLNEIYSCEVCGNSRLESVLDLGTHPLCDDLVPVEDTRVCDEYPIEVLYCSQCVTAHQRFQVPKQQLFPATYHYRSRFTSDVLKGMSTLTDSCESRLHSLRDKLVLDVGCNDGSLLDLFLKKGARTVGIEPTDAYRDGLGKGHELVKAFLSPESARELRQEYGLPDIITFTNVFAHIENLPEVLEALRILMSPSTLLVVENHYLGAVLDRHQFDTFYHEHPRTYSLTSYQYIAKRLGADLTNVEFPSRYGGNIRVFVGGPSAGERADFGLMNRTLEHERDFGRRLSKMRIEIRRWQLLMAERISNAVQQHGKLVAKAFPGRAAILIKLLGLDVDTIEAVFEKPGSMKIGNFVPGTRIPILSDSVLFTTFASRPMLLNLAWHIADEIRSYLRSQGFRGEIIDIFDPAELYS